MSQRRGHPRLGNTKRRKWLKRAHPLAGACQVLPLTQRNQVDWLGVQLPEGLLLSVSDFPEILPAIYFPELTVLGKTCIIFLCSRGLEMKINNVNAERRSMRILFAQFWVDKSPAAMGRLQYLLWLSGGIKLWLLPMTPAQATFIFRRKQWLLYGLCF